MKNALRLIPWVLTVAMGAILFVTWSASREKDNEISSLKKQYGNLVTETDAKYKQLADDAKAKVAEVADEANAKVAQLTDEANSKIALANQREVPVRVTFRKALLSSGEVAMISNTANQTIAVTVQIARPSTDQRKTIPLTIDAGVGAAIGQQEGWAFVAGDTLTITQPDHKSLAFTSP